jgi:hypothetical protein
MLILGILSGLTLLITPSCGKVDDASDILNGAINSMENESIDWRVALEDTIEKLRKEDYPHIADEVNALFQRSIAAAGTQIFCIIDRIEGRVIRGLARIRANLLGQSAEPLRVPTVCQSVPDRIRTADPLRPDYATFYGFDLDAANLELVLVNQRPRHDGTLEEIERDVTAFMERGSAHYERRVNLGGTGIQLTTDSSALRLVQRKPGGGGSEVIGSILVTQPRCVETEESTEVPALTLTPKLQKGDSEFFGNGPSIQVQVRVFPAADGRSLQGSASMRADETNDGDTKSFHRHDWQILSARQGEAIGAVTSRADDNLIEEAPDQTTFYERPGKGLVRLYQVVGDTAGADIGKTGVKIFFNRVHFKLNACR